MASLSGLGPHQTWKELLRLDNSITRNQGVTAGLQTVTDGDGGATSLQLSSTSAQINGTCTANALVSTGSITGLGLNGTSLSIAPSGLSAIGGISATGAITGVSLDVGNGSVAAGSVNVGTGTVTGAQFTGNAATVTNGVYQSSTYFIGTTSNAFNRASAAQTLNGVSISGDAGTVGGIPVHSGTETQNTANKIVRTNASGEIIAGNISSVSGNNTADTTSVPSRIWGVDSTSSFLKTFNILNLNNVTVGTWTPQFTSVGVTSYVVSGVTYPIFRYTAAGTPVLTGPTPIQSGKYFRIGKLVFAMYRIVAAIATNASAVPTTYTNNTSATLGMTNFPFTSSAEGQGGNCFMSSIVNLKGSELPNLYLFTNATAKFATTSSGTDYAVGDSGMTTSVTRGFYGVAIYEVP